MKCESCNQPASVYFTQISKGQMTKCHLCADCAKERGITDPTAFSFADQILQQANADLSNPRSGPISASCPNCGFTAEDFRKTQRLGCSQCYLQFRSELLPMLGSMHEGVLHQGKLPKGFATDQRLRTELSDLQEQLQLAIAEESYERAAELRDQIKEIEQKLA